MAPAQSTLRRRLRDDYALPFAAHYLSRRRLYSNLLMVAFSAYVLQNVRRLPPVPVQGGRGVAAGETAILPANRSSR